MYGEKKNNVRGNETFRDDRYKSFNDDDCSKAEYCGLWHFRLNPPSVIGDIPYGHHAWT